MDIDEDRKAGRKSTAIMIGVVPAKLLLVTIMVCLAMIAYQNFQGPTVAIFMTLGAVFFAFDTCFGPSRYPVWFSRLFFLGWNLVVIASMHFVWKYGIFLST